MTDAEHPLLEAIRELVDRVGGTVIGPDEVTGSDVPLRWEGRTVGGVRLPAASPSEPTPGDLDALLAHLADELGGPLSELDRKEKQRAVRLLEERGAFSYRKSTETVAEALGVTRFTVYNYLNRLRA
ncbi:helix-turn-helix domain-containing protein [Tsukamurella sp. PLM1]|uniref:helix-turn-helix domain-containing protein n=1 Tax=Tsukamurella sp. PLM1 TaxID=2929795 RepID=UPI00207113AA|nr:helix-turn-helix domain-containing protein [Tsukamurella sp. PLM1]BDH56426.1 DNA-binding protein [Tsukamurella sp. PLM1]